MFIHLTSIIAQASQSCMQKSPKSPVVTSFRSRPRFDRYRARYSSFTRPKCTRSQCRRTNRDVSNSYLCSTGLDFDNIFSITCRNKSASRTGRLITPFSTCAIISPYNRLCQSHGHGILEILESKLTAEFLLLFKASLAKFDSCVLS